ncbi:acyl carrier protein [bacterium]|nr:acyl carrier protein [bacterium]
MYETVHQVVLDMLGTTVPGDASLMGAGLDSLAATELVSSLSDKMSTDIEPTALFDHPTVKSLSKFFD